MNAVTFRYIPESTHCQESQQASLPLPLQVIPNAVIPEPQEGAVVHAETAIFVSNSMEKIKAVTFENFILI